MIGRLTAAAAALAVCALGTGAHAAKPVTLTYYLHGYAAYDDLESNKARDKYLLMDRKKPTGAEAKSKQAFSYGVGPDNRCAGNTLMPAWTGELSGVVAGDVKVTLTATGTVPGAAVDVALYADVEKQDCAAVVAGSATVNLPSARGKVEVVLKKVKLKARTRFMLQINPRPFGLSTDPTSQGRIYYDSTADASSITFPCQLPATPLPGIKGC